MPYPPDDITFRPANPDPSRPEDMAQAIRRLSLYQMQRLYMPPKVVTADHTIEGLDEKFILADASAGNLIIDLPPADSADATPYTIMKTDAASTNLSSELVTLRVNGGVGSETVDGLALLRLHQQGESVTVISDGSNYQTIGASIGRVPHLVGSSTGPVFATGWSSASYGYWISKAGRWVTIQGRATLTTGGGATTTIFTLPDTGLRPNQMDHTFFAGFKNTTAERFSITNGGLYRCRTLTNANVYYSSITYYAS